MKAKVVGAGFFGCTCARVLADSGWTVDVVEARDRIGGNCSTYDLSGIEVHRYGSHIFHTDDKRVWDFINRFAEFNGYRHQVLAQHNGRRYFLPFGLPLLSKFFDREFTPIEADTFMKSVRSNCSEPANLEVQAISLVGKDIYEAFVRNYTKKQWHADPKDLDVSIIRRLPVRMTYDVSYFNDRWQGIPVSGYQSMFEQMVDHPSISVSTGVSYVERDLINDCSYDKIIYTGPLDELFGYRYGALAWRSLRFETETVEVRDFQGTSVINYVDEDPVYTRVHEFKHYHPERQAGEVTIIQREYPQNWSVGLERYYPVNNVSTVELQQKYLDNALEYENLVIGGRLGLYKYFDMDDTISAALDTCDRIMGN